MDKNNRSDGAEELIEMGLGFGVHANDDDQWNEAIVGDDLGLFHGPSAPLLEALCS